MGVADYLVGRRVYNGGTNAPTRGTVDPMGYIDRELNMAGSRSGLASAALRRMSSAAAPTGTSSSPSQVQTQSLVGTSGPTTSTGGIPGQVGSIPPSVLRVNQVGRLQVPDLDAIARNFEAPFDPEKEDALIDLQGQRNRFNSDMTQAGQGLEREYTIKRRGAEIEQPYNVRHLIDDYSGRGLVHSSGYTTDFGQMQQQYADMLRQLDEDRAFGQTDLIRQQGLFNDDYTNKLTGIQAAAARKAAAALAQKQQDDIDAAAAANADVLEQRGNIPTLGSGVGTKSPYVAPEGYTDATVAGGAPQISGPGGSFYVGPSRPWSPGQPAGFPAPSVTPTTFPMGQPSAPMASVPVASNPPAPSTAPAMNPSTLRWEGPIYARSRATLAAGGRVTRGNGYVYQMSGPNGTGVPIRVA